ncbi:MAG: hypothetical protein JXQ23_12155 [Clostridia bacterium]|nr:hypothetical protein [Clostridia bacterium]
MKNLIKYELYKNRIFLILATSLTLLFGALPLPIAIKGNPDIGLNYIVPILILMMIFYGITLGMLIFMIFQQREIWNRNGILLYSIPVSRFKIFSAKIVTGLVSTLVLLGITFGYVAIYIKILNGSAFMKELFAAFTGELAIMSILASIGSWLYWLMTIIFLIIMSKTVLGHHKSKGFIIPLLAIGLLIALPIGVSLLANASLVTAGIEAAFQTQYSSNMDFNITFGNTINFWVSIAFNWLMAIGMFISCGVFLKKKLNI